MRILVTGSKGLLGKEVCAEIKRKKHKIIEYDFADGKNILDTKNLEKEMKNAKEIIHLAGIINTKDPNLHKINVEGTKSVIKAAKKAKIKKIVFMSTTGVYGFTNGKVDEKTKINPENEYEKSKAEGEKLIKESDLKFCIIRSAMILGANEYWKKMFKMIKEKLPLPMKGENKFQIIYSKELARAVVIVLEKGKKGETYLVAGKEKPTLNEFCEMIQEEMKVKKGMTHIPKWIALAVGKIIRSKLLTSENIRHLSKERDYDTSKIQELGWKQKTTLRKAIKEILKQIK